jgi:hypothetical protein
MGEYRLYCLDGAGKIGLAEEITAVDDQDAIQQAYRLKQRALKCEVWQGRRLVSALTAQDLGGLSG